MVLSLLKRLFSSNETSSVIEASASAVLPFLRTAHQTVELRAFMTPRLHTLIYCFAYGALEVEALERGMNETQQLAALLHILNTLSQLEPQDVSALLNKCMTTMQEEEGHGCVVAGSDAYRAWREATDEYEHLRQAASDRDTRLDFLRYQVQELETLAPQEDEHARLEQEHVRLANVSRLQDTAHRHIEALDDNEEISATALLSRAVSELDSLREMDGRLGDIADSLNSALTNVEDASKELRHYLDSLDADPARLTEIDSRLGSFLDLARKHHVKPGELLQQLDELSKELDGLQHAETRLEGLQADINKHFSAYGQLADKLSKSRRKHARTLAKQVTGHMQELGMPGGHFDIVLHARDQAVPSAEGMEKVEFMVSANPGQALKALNKVASGGELSRISLAIQVVLANNVRIPTLIFDEVDVGIGGGVAEIVGNRLRSLADNRQVLCVTHLPQVASQAHHHLQVSKTRGKDHTGTAIQSLDEAARNQEIARMLGGVEITEQTLAHAKEMLSKAN